MGNMMCNERIKPCFLENKISQMILPEEKKVAEALTNGFVSDF